MVAFTIEGGITFEGGISVGPDATGSSSFTISTSDYTNYYVGGGAGADSVSFAISGIHFSTQAFYGPQLGTTNGGSSIKSQELVNFWNNNGLSFNQSYLFDVTWGTGSSTNTTRNVVDLIFSYSGNVDNTWLCIGTVDTNITGWDTPGQSPLNQIQSAQGTFNMPATFTLIQPTIQDTYDWC